MRRLLIAKTSQNKNSQKHSRSITLISKTLPISLLNLNNSTKFPKSSPIPWISLTNNKVS